MNNVDFFQERTEFGPSEIQISIVASLFYEDKFYYDFVRNNNETYAIWKQT